MQKASSKKLTLRKKAAAKTKPLATRKSKNTNQASKRAISTKKLKVSKSGRATKPKLKSKKASISYRSNRALLSAEFKADRELTKVNVTQLQNIIRSAEYKAFLNDDVCGAWAMEGTICSKEYATQTKAGLAIFPRLAKFESAKVTLLSAKCVAIVYTVKLINNTLLGKTTSNEFSGVTPGLKLVPRKENLQALSNCLQECMNFTMNGGGHTTHFNDFKVEVLPTCNDVDPWTMNYL